jgi:uncharacterized protein YqjF (DUF2071 family)
MHPSLREMAHRPWPLPKAKWTWRQSWLDLAFIHYRISAASLRRMIPEQLQVQEWDGSAWVGLVPFRMAGVMKRPLPDLPGFIEFPEMNLRTYVEVDGKPGVWFFSLDAASWPVVWGGRHLYGLPYFSAKMRQKQQDGWWNYSSRRGASGALFTARYRPVGDPVSRGSRDVRALGCRAVLSLCGKYGAQFAACGGASRALAVAAGGGGDRDERYSERGGNHSGERTARLSLFQRSRCGFFPDEENWPVKIVENEESRAVRSTPASEGRSLAVAATTTS